MFFFLGSFHEFLEVKKGHLTHSYIVLFYSPRALSVLDNMHFSLYVIFTHTHTLMDALESNLGLVICSRIFGLQTGATNNQSTVLVPKLYKHSRTHTNNRNTLTGHFVSDTI